MIKSTRTLGISFLLLFLVGCAAGNRGLSETSRQATVIDLTQTGCQFLEVEAKDYQYQPQNSQECQQINTKTLSERKTGFKPLELTAGTYIFRITNSDVPYELGFYLRGEGANKLTLPKISGGGLTQGKTQDYTVNLKPGNYIFSCPLNPTPNYPIVVN